MRMNCMKENKEVRNIEDPKLISEYSEISDYTEIQNSILFYQKLNLVCFALTNIWMLLNDGYLDDIFLHLNESKQKKYQKKIFLYLKLAWEAEHKRKLYQIFRNELLDLTDFIDNNQFLRWFQDLYFNSFDIA